MDDLKSSESKTDILADDQNTAPEVYNVPVPTSLLVGGDSARSEMSQSNLIITCDVPPMIQIPPLPNLASPLHSPSIRTCNLPSPRLQSPRSGGMSSPNGTTGEPVDKQQCLRLIDQIWKGGLDYNLSQLKNRRRRLDHSHDEDSGSEHCNHCGIRRTQDGSIRRDSWSSEDSALSGESDNQKDVTVEKQCDPDQEGTYKKARYGWQIKKSKKSGTVLGESSDSCDSLPSTSSSFVMDIMAPTDHRIDKDGSRKRSLSGGNDPQLKHCRLDKEQQGDESADDVFNESCPLQLATNTIGETTTAMTNPLQSPVHLPCVVESGDSSSVTEQPKQLFTIQEDEAPILQQWDENPETTSADNSLQDIHTSPPMSPPLAITQAAQYNEPYPGRGPRPSAQDFNVLSQVMGRLTSTERWQCQHVAKSIVDNAINKTLENMGLSPNPNAAQYTNQRNRIEDVGVSHAIRMQGLQRYSPDRLNRLNPLISRLTQVSENLFAQQQQQPHGDQQRSSDQSESGSSLPSPTFEPSVSEVSQTSTTTSGPLGRRCTSSHSGESLCSLLMAKFGSSINETSGSDDAQSTSTESGLFTTLSVTNSQSGSSTDMLNDRSLMRLVMGNPNRLLRTDEGETTQGTPTTPTLANISPCHRTVKSSQDSHPELIICSGSTGKDTVIQENVTPPSENSPTSKTDTSFLLDQAIDAVINEKGLHFNTP